MERRDFIKTGGVIGALNVIPIVVDPPGETGDVGAVVITKLGLSVE